MKKILIVATTLWLTLSSGCSAPTVAPPPTPEACPKVAVMAQMKAWHGVLKDELRLMKATNALTARDAMAQAQVKQRGVKDTPMAECAAKGKEVVVAAWEGAILTYEMAATLKPADRVGAMAQWVEDAVKRVEGWQVGE